MTKNQCKEAWKGFSTELNSLGSPTRTPPNCNVIVNRHFIRIFTTYRIEFTTGQVLKKKSSNRRWSFTRNSI